MAQIGRPLRGAVAVLSEYTTIHTDKAHSIPTGLIAKMKAMYNQNWTRALPQITLTPATPIAPSVVWYCCLERNRRPAATETPRIEDLRNKRCCEPIAYRQYTI